MGNERPLAELLHTNVPMFIKITKGIKYDNDELVKEFIKLLRSDFGVMPKKDEFYVGFHWILHGRSRTPSWTGGTQCMLLSVDFGHPVLHGQAHIAMYLQDHPDYDYNRAVSNLTFNLPHHDLNVEYSLSMGYCEDGTTEENIERAYYILKERWNSFLSDMRFHDYLIEKLEAWQEKIK